MFMQFALKTEEIKIFLFTEVFPVASETAKVPIFHAFEVPIKQKPVKIKRKEFVHFHIYLK